MRIKTLYEDADFLVIDKPSGIFVHPSTVLRAGPGESTVLDLMKKKYPGIQLSHRLDKETSGVLALAKNDKAHRFLKRQFQNREVKKTYLAIVSGWVKNDHGIINKPIGRSPADFRRRLAGRGVRGKIREAITEYKVSKRFEDSGNKFSYLEIKPKTGRTHQIRVHMKFINHPVACDSLYNPKGACPAGFDRLALHARSIEFSAMGGSASGGKNKTIKVESPLPKKFKKVVE